MIGKSSKNETREKIHTRIRKTAAGTTARPRLNVYRSVSHIYVQVIDDSKRHDDSLGQLAGAGQGGDGKKHSDRRQHCGGQAGRQV